MSNKRIQIALPHVGADPSRRLQACLGAIQVLASDLLITKEFLAGLRQQAEMIARSRADVSPAIPLQTVITFARYQYENCLFRKQALHQRVSDIESILVGSAGEMVPPDAPRDEAGIRAAHRPRSSAILTQIRGALGPDAQRGDALVHGGFFKIALIEEPQPVGLAAEEPPEGDVAVALGEFIARQEATIGAAVSLARALEPAIREEVPDPT